jgi:hypothetical protein
MMMMEKILVWVLECASLEPRENVDMLTHDVCGSSTIDIFNKEFGEDAKVSCHDVDACGLSTDAVPS